MELKKLQSKSDSDSGVSRSSAPGRRRAPPALTVRAAAMDRGGDGGDNSKAISPGDTGICSLLSHPLDGPVEFERAYSPPDQPSAGFLYVSSSPRASLANVASGVKVATHNGDNRRTSSPFSGNNSFQDCRLPRHRPGQAELAEEPVSS